MSTWFARLRGVLSIGAIWGGLGAVVGGVGGAIAGLFGGVPLGSALLAGGLGAGMLGFVLGTGFAATLTLLERGRTLGQLTPGRAAVWGGLAGAALPVVLFLVSFGSVVGTRLSIGQYLLAMLAGSAAYGALSAGLAAGTLALARREAPELEAGANPAVDAFLDPGGPTADT